MATQLKNIVQFVNVAAGGTAVLPHGLNINGVGLIPDLLMQPRPDFTVTADDTNITVTNNSLGVATVDVCVEH